MLVIALVVDLATGAYGKPLLINKFIFDGFMVIVLGSFGIASVDKWINKKDKKRVMSLKSLQEKIGVTADGAFGPGTLKAAMAYYKLTPVRAAHFFAQTAHETGEYKLFSENLNYSAAGLQGTFGKYFPGTLEESYARNLKKLLTEFTQIEWVTETKLQVTDGNTEVVVHYN
jgi:hypothetical protein